MGYSLHIQWSIRVSAIEWIGISRAEAKKRVGKLSFRYLKGNFKISGTEPRKKDRTFVL